MRPGMSLESLLILEFRAVSGLGIPEGPQMAGGRAYIETSWTMESNQYLSYSKDLQGLNHHKPCVQQC